MMKNSSEWTWAYAFFIILLIFLVFVVCSCSPRKELGETPCERFLKERNQVATTVYDPELRHNLLEILDSMIEKSCAPNPYYKSVE